MWPLQPLPGARWRCIWARIPLTGPRLCRVGELALSACRTDFCPSSAASGPQPPDTLPEVRVLPPREGATLKASAAPPP